jgi:hypothetical protein
MTAKRITFLDQDWGYLPNIQPTAVKKLAWPDTTRPAAGAIITMRNYLSDPCGGYPMV